ncbi:MAG: 50S ribosomal protein L11 methyltransferase [Pseudomonadota bacterium]
MTTYTALTTLPGRAPAEALGLAIEALNPAPTGVGVFEIEDGSGLWEVGGYFTERPDPAGLALLAAMHGAADFTVSKLDDRDWVAQVRRDLTPVVAGRFVLHGAHDAASVPPQAVGLRIEAAMAFGTGHHGTTQGCLLLLEHLLRHGVRARQVLDLGCGTGVLAMAAAASLHARCLAADIDPLAVATARENIRINRLHSLIGTVEATGLTAERLRRHAPYDLVFANILAGPLKRLARPVAGAMAPGGHLILSGVLTEQARGVEAVYRGFGFSPVERLALGPWTSLCLRRGRGQK